MQDSVYRVAEHVSFEKVEDGTILMDLRKGKYLSLNRVASDIWDLVSQQDSMASMTQGLVETYDVEPERAREDVMTTLAGWTSLGLIERCG